MSPQSEACIGLVMFTQDSMFILGIVFLCLHTNSIEIAHSLFF